MIVRRTIVDSSCEGTWSTDVNRRSLFDRLALPTVAVAMLVAAPGVALAHGEAEEHTEPHDQLALDEVMFWEGETVADGQVRDASLCDVLGPCPTYTLNVVEGAARLRVGIDSAERTDTWAIDLIDPSGTVAGTDSTFNQFNSEVLVDEPAAGEWTVLIRPEDVTDASFRMRAKLESTTSTETLAAGPKRLLLPNLRTIPPYEFGFVAPANPLNGVYPPDTVNPPLSVAGVEPLSCSADEALPVELGGGGAVKCLRLTSGPMNIGEGIYDMRFRFVDDLVAGDSEVSPEEAFSRIVIGPLDQALHYSDGSVEYREAGTYSFHPIHGHFHDDYILTYELWEIVDEETGELAQVGTGTKSGFCPADQLFGDWFSFTQEYETPVGDSPFDNCFSPTDGTMGLSTGWGDVYRWQRPGQYVEFGDNPNGRYIVRSIVDKENNVLEENEDDNVSYTCIDVQGDTIEIIERGFGSDPWDPDKWEFFGPGPASRPLVKSNINACGTPVTVAAASAPAAASTPTPAPAPAEAAVESAATGSLPATGAGMGIGAGVVLLADRLRRRRD